VPTGTGLTVTTTGKAALLQPFALATTKYSTLPPAALVNVWLITVPLPAAWPLTVPVTVPNVQLNVVPLTPFGLLITTLLVLPLQMFCALALTVGTGLTVTT
jgi:hypothetical protein